MAGPSERCLPSGKPVPSCIEGLPSTAREDKLAPENKIVDLLEWAARHGFKPRRPGRNDLFLLPDGAVFTVKRHRELEPHQHRAAYWLPDMRGLASLGLPVRKLNVKGLTVLKVLNFMGAGEGEHEAALSVVNQMRGQFSSKLAA